MTGRSDESQPPQGAAGSGDGPQFAAAAESVARLRARHRTTCAAIQQSLSGGAVLERLRLSMAEMIPAADRRSAATLAGILACVDLWIRR
jgi:hypothetical protein